MLSAKIIVSFLFFFFPFDKLQCKERSRAAGRLSVLSLAACSAPTHAFRQKFELPRYPRVQDFLFGWLLFYAES